MDILDLSVGEKKSRRKAQIPQRRATPQPRPGNAVADGSYHTPIVGVEHKMEILLNSQRLGAYQSRVLKKPPFNEHDSSGELEAKLTQSPCLSERSNENEPSRSSSPDTLLSSYKNAFNISLRTPNSIEAAAAFNYGNSPVVSNAGSPGVASQKKGCSPLHLSGLELCERSYDELSDRTAPSPIQMKDLSARVEPAYKMAKYGDDVRPADTPGIPERTKKQNRWAFNVWREWARKRNIANGTCNNQESVPLDVGKATEVELDHWLSKFVQEVRRKDGNPYPPHTLMQIVMGIQRYLRQQAGRPSICILDRSNPTYSGFRCVLDERIKQLTSDGVMTTSKSGRRSSLPSGSHSLISNNSCQYPDEATLWDSGVIGSDSALRLLNAVFYHNTVTFGIRTIDDHWNLKMCHFLVSAQPPFFVEFLPSLDPVYVNRGMTKNRRIYEEPGNPRCVVKLFKRYIAHVPPSGAFYRHPQEPTLVDRSIRFSDQWIGKNRLRAMIKHIFDSTRLDRAQKAPPRQVAWPTLALDSTVASNTALPENRLVTPYAAAENIYDRLAQAVLHLSSRNKPLATCDSPHSSERSSPVRHGADNETPKEILPEIKSEDASSLRLLSDSRLHGGDTKRARLESGCSSESGDKFQDERALEITVPSLLKTVIIHRGAKRVVVNLE